MLVKPRNVPQQSYNSTQFIDYQLFPEEYFSGCDVNVYFGDVWVDEIVSLQFSLQENVAPIYSYVSYTYDAAARGNRIIQGSFRINFKEAYYLKSVVNEAIYSKTSTKPPFTYSQNPVENTIEGIFSKTQDMSQSQFETLANAYEKALWGENTTKVKISDNSTPYFKDNFNILVTYGAIAEAYKAYSAALPIHETIMTVTGVQLTGSTQVIEPSGQPIFEEYTFIARDLNGNFRK